MNWSLITGVLGGTLGGNVITQIVVQWYAARQQEKDRVAVRRDSHRSELRNAYAQLISGVDEFLDLSRDFVGVYRRAAGFARRVGLMETETKALAKILAETGEELAELETLIEDAEAKGEQIPFAVFERIRKKHERTTLTNSEISERQQRVHEEARDLNREGGSAIARVQPLALRFPAAAEQIRIKGVVVKLLENDPTRASALDALLSEIVPDPLHVKQEGLHSEPEKVEEFIANILRAQKERVKLRDELMKLLAGMDAP